MDLLKFGRSSIVVVVALGGAWSPAFGQMIGKRIFSTSSSCELSTLLTADECRNAQANALAELDEKSPRFPSRAECEKSFRRCMIAGFDRKRVEFEPALRGFEVNVRSATDKTVVPLVDGDGSVLGFHSRTVLRADAGISHMARDQAQARWAQEQKARAAANSAGAPAGELDVGGEAPNSRALNSPSPDNAPPSEADLAAQARRRDEIRRAPTLY